MSIDTEKIRAQGLAFNHTPRQAWQHHLMGPAELRNLLGELKRLQERVAALDGAKTPSEAENKSGEAVGKEK